MDEQTIHKLNNTELLLNLERQFEAERKISHVILLYLKEVRARRLFADRGFGSLFEMLVKHFHLSETSANQRLKALDLMVEVPVVEEKLKAGSVNLSTLAMAQRQIRREEKITGKKVDQDKKAEIVKRIADKTQAQAEVELFHLLPESATQSKTHERRVSFEATRVSLTLPDRVREKLFRLKEVWAHVNPAMDYVEIIERAADVALVKADPLVRAEKRKTKSAVATRNRSSVAQDGMKRPTYYSVKIDDELWTRSGGQCEFIDSETDRRYSCRFGLEREHVIPFAIGGSSDISNLKLLCRHHNLLMARRHFGSAKIEKEIRKNR